MPSPKRRASISTNIKEVLVSQFTGGRTSSLRGMTPAPEYEEMCSVSQTGKQLGEPSAAYGSGCARARSAALNRMQRLGVDTADRTFAAVDEFCLDPRIAGKRFRDADRRRAAGSRSKAPGDPAQTEAREAAAGRADSDFYSTEPITELIWRNPTITVDLSGEQGNIFTLMSEARAAILSDVRRLGFKHRNREKSKIETKAHAEFVAGRMMHEVMQTHTMTGRSLSFADM